MFRRFLRRFFSRSVVWQRSIVELTDLEALCRTSLAGMLLAQEKARLDFLGAREENLRRPSRASADHMHQRLAHLQATNALVQSCLNEHSLEQRLAAEAPVRE